MYACGRQTYQYLAQGGWRLAAEPPSPILPASRFANDARASGRMCARVSIAVEHVVVSDQYPEAHDLGLQLAHQLICAGGAGCCRSEG